MTLFDPGPTTPAPDAGLSAGARRTIRNRSTLAAGIHPAARTALLDPEWGYTCAGCAHLAVNVTRPGRRFHKCRLVPITNGPGTDIRTSWPACARFRIEAVA